MSSKIKYLIIFLFVFSLTNISFAEENRSYFISSFDVSVGIKKDSTIDVTERITYDFTGRYNQGWRSISLKNLSRITDIKVIDVDTEKELEYSSKTLDRLDPSSWGKYAVTYSDGYVNIEWYYDISDRQYIWDIKYTAHGAVGFYDDFDEVYWNIFTEYQVPVSHVSAIINFLDIPDPKTDQLAWYRTVPNETGNFYRYDDGYFLFDSDIAPNESITFAIGFSKGLVSYNAFIFDFIKVYFGIFISIALIFLIVFISILVWFRREYLQKRDRSVVTQFEPPQKLKPGQMDIIYREGFSKKTWVATLIDLAVRGYLRIEDDPSNEKTLKKIFNIKDYKVSLVNINYLNDDRLETYEKSFVQALMQNKDYFSTAELKKDIVKAKRLHNQIKKIEKESLKEISLDYPDVYLSNFGSQTKLKPILAILTFIILFGHSFFIEYGYFLFYVQLLVLFLGLLLTVILYLYLIKHNPRLSHLGNELWRDVVGFKTYLGVAEKYRMQNLTPEIFEKYLPYAMIFNLEKKWVKNFESIITEPPRWYGNGVSAGAGLSVNNFSISSFSNSFSKSFTSAFASSGGGGSRGGGGAGGGSGGGGGGAR